MKLACSALAWLEHDDAAAAAVVVEGGLDAIELLPTRYWPGLADASIDAVARCRDWWLERGLRIAAIQSVLFGRPDLILFGGESVRESLAAHLASALQVAATLGAGAVVFGSPRNRVRGSLSEAEALRIALPFFRDLATRAVDLGTCLCVEPNPVEYGTDFLNTVEEAASFVRLVGHPGVGLQLDAGALALTGGDPRRAVIDHAGLIRHVHASEPFLAPLVSGRPSHSSLADALRTAGYGGYVSLEMNPGSLDSLRDAIAALRETYGG